MGVNVSGQNGTFLKAFQRRLISSGVLKRIDPAPAVLKFWLVDEFRIMKLMASKAPALFPPEGVFDEIHLHIAQGFALVEHPRPYVGVPSPSANAPVGESAHAENIKPGTTNYEGTAAKTPQSPVKTEDSPVPEKAVTAEPAETEVVSVNPEAATLSEKAKAYKLASSKLSAGEISSLIKWSQGGFTQEEKEKAKALFYSRFTAEEQQWILGLFRKYGQ